MLDGRLGVEAEDILFAHFDGQLAENFRWSSEFDRLGSKDLVLCLNHWVLGTDGETVLVGAAGPVVGVSMVGKGLLSIILEENSTLIVGFN